MDILIMLSQATPSSFTDGLMQYGAIGICLAALAIYFVYKDHKADGRNNEMREMEKAFRKEQAELQERFRAECIQLAEKYRLALEKFQKALDVVVGIVRDK